MCLVEADREQGRAITRETLVTLVNTILHMRLRWEIVAWVLARLGAGRWPITRDDGETATRGQASRGEVGIESRRRRTSLRGAWPALCFTGGAKGRGRGSLRKRGDRGNAPPPLLRGQSQRQPRLQALNGGRPGPGAEPRAKPQPQKARLQWWVQCLGKRWRRRGRRRGSGDKEIRTVRRPQGYR